MTPAWSPQNLVLLVVACIPVIFALAALLGPSTAPLRRAIGASSLALGLALAAAVGAVVVPSSSTSSLATGLARLVRLDLVTAVMLVLVCTLALVIARYSRAYLAGEPGQPRYERALLATLAAVTTVVAANDLIVLAVAWMGTSFALDQLLTFYRGRTQALVTAHKKFLLSRLADVFVLGALALLGLSVGSLGLDDVHAWARAHADGLPPAAHVAAVLLVIAVSLRSAQIPFHGWLIQVMEAPTPVSALLHAGVVNIGGLVLIRLAPLMAHAGIAQTLLVVIGTITVVIAALVMSTQVTVKVALAWSTCAQMGFMLVECGLGAWHLALLHLVAHSLYKAHAFLGAGAAVDAWRVAAMAPRRAPVALGRVLVVAAVTVAAVTTMGVVTERFGPGHGSPTMWPLAVILGLSLAPFVAQAMEGGWRLLAAAAAAALGITLFYFGCHALAVQLSVVPVAVQASGLDWGIAVAGLTISFGLQVVLQARPQGRLARVLRPRLFAGFYLDEVFTRMTFRLWPPTLPPRDAAVGSLYTTKTVEA